LFYSKFDSRKIFKIQEVISSAQAQEKPKKQTTLILEDTVLKKVLRELTGRKNQIDEQASLIDWMYTFPNRQPSIKQLRSDTFTFLSKHGQSADQILKAPVCLLMEVRAAGDRQKMQFGYRLSQMGPLHSAPQKKLTQKQNLKSLNSIISLCKHPFLN
jgi:hypothetical protein